MKSHLQSKSIQHFSLLPLTWTDVPLGEVVMSGQDPLDLSGGENRRSPDAPHRQGCCFALADPRLKFPN